MGSSGIYFLFFLGYSLVASQQTEYSVDFWGLKPPHLTSRGLSFARGTPTKDGVRCGKGFGTSCEKDECCSQSGFCGKTEEFCFGPDNCQINYGPNCDANVEPDGPSTLNIRRPRLGKVSYGGVIIKNCTNPGTAAITLDDGPFNWTQNVLDTLENYNAKATFFINGNNKGKGQISNRNTRWPELIKKMYNAGHQIGSHTWSHENLNDINEDQRKHQIYANEAAIGSILDVFPSYMRPPYTQCDATCKALMDKLGYHIIYGNVDTRDTEYGTNLQATKDAFDADLSKSNGNPIIFAHEIQPDTANHLVEYMLKALNNAHLRAVTVGQCLGDPAENWYRTISGLDYTPPESWHKFLPVSPSSSSNPSSSTASSGTSLNQKSSTVYTSSTVDRSSTISIGSSLTASTAASTTATSTSTSTSTGTSTSTSASPSTVKAAKTSSSVTHFTLRFGAWYYTLSIISFLYLPALS